MPFRRYSSIEYFERTNELSFESLTINGGIWLANTSSIWGGKYKYTFSTYREECFDSKEQLDIFLNKLNPTTIAERYKMRNFVYNNQIKETDVQFSQGTIWVGDGENTDDGGYKGKVDIQTCIRSICREEIEYALWNYTSKLIENNNGEQLLKNLNYQNIDSFRLKWFFYSKFPVQNITINGLPSGTDDTEFTTINKNINIIKKIFIPTNIGNIL